MRSLLTLTVLATLADGVTAQTAGPVTEAAAPDAAVAAASDTPAAADHAAPANVYMVARVKLTGTDFTQVVLFRHNAITTLEACEAERQAGLTTGWNYFSRYYLQTLKGISYKVDYRCVEGEQQFAAWRKGMPLDNFYLITTFNNRLQVQPQRNFFECRDALKRISQGESIDTFCGISSQAILK